VTSDPKKVEHKAVPRVWYQHTFSDMLLGGGMVKVEMVWRLWGLTPCATIINPEDDLHDETRLNAWGP
jgi:hypothetical protein